MKESAQIALTSMCVRLHLDYGVKENYFEKHDIHRILGGRGAGRMARLGPELAMAIWRCCRR